MREAEATADAERLFGIVDARLQTQSARMDNLFQLIQNSCKESSTNAETIQTLLISIKNLSGNFQHMHEDMMQWDEPAQPMDETEEREYQATVKQFCKRFLFQWQVTILL